MSTAGLLLVGHSRVNSYYVLAHQHYHHDCIEPLTHPPIHRLIQNLLQNAKLRFAQAEDSSGVELCDTYLSRVELLRLLVASQCPKIPSIQELTKPDLARRVRDKLMQENRFKLAMEVSTKCQLDSGEVLAAWGIACLKCGNFQGARAKFKNCFQVSCITNGFVQRFYSVLR